MYSSTGFPIRSSSSTSAGNYQGQSGEASLAPSESGNDFRSIDEELEQLLRSTASDHVMSRHVIKAKLDGMLGNSSDSREAGSEVEHSYDELR